MSWRATLAGLLAGTSALLLAWPDTPAGPLDGAAFDLLAPRAPDLESPVEGVAITQEDVERFPRFGRTPGEWPWKRIAHAGVIHALQVMKARAVGVDLFFERPGEAGSDRALVHELATAGIPVILAAYQSHGPTGPAGETLGWDLDLAAAVAAGLVPPDYGALHPPLETLRVSGVELGLVNLPPEGVARSRAVPMVFRAGPRLLPGMALACALAARGAGDASWEPGPTLVVGDLRVPLTADGSALLDLAPVPQRSVGQLLGEFGQRLGPSAGVEGKVFVVGLGGAPLGAVHATSRGALLPSFQLQAAATRAVLEARVVRPASPVEVGALLWFLLLAFAALRSGPEAVARRPTLTLVAGGALAAILSLTLMTWALWVPVTAFTSAALLGLLPSTLATLWQRALTRRARDAEMARAEELAACLLPEALPDNVTGRLVPARVAAGDYYDAIPLPDGAQMLVVADVSGKGLDGALLAGELRALFRALAATAPSPGELLTSLNASLYADLLRAGRLATCLVVRIRPDGELTVAAAAHPPLLVVTPGRPPVAVEARGKPLGYRPQVRYRESRAHLPEGGMGILLSDGVLETPLVDGAELPGLEGLLEALACLERPGHHALETLLLRHVDEARDDRTLLLFSLPEASG